MSMVTASQVQPYEVPSLAERSSAHQWLTVRWKFIRSITKRVRGETGSDVPGTSQNGILEWTKITKHVFLTQLGLGSRTSKATESMTIVPMSFFATMKIDVPALSKWITSEQAKGFGSIEECMKVCSRCGTGELTLCLMQGGMPVCTRREDMHRDIYLPPDVVLGEQQKSDLDVYDKVLRYAGFHDGRASTNIVSLETIKASITSSDVTFTEQDICYLQVQCKMDITKWEDLVANKVKDELAKMIRRSLGMRLVGKQHCNAAPRYYTWTLQKGKNKK
jgi:hypothetical protein